MKITWRDLVFCTLLTFAFILLTLHVYNLPFAVGDDHRIIAMNHPEKMETAYVQALFNNNPDLAGTLKNDAMIGRFRPLGWTFTKLQCVLLGDNSSAWRIFNVLLLFLSLLTFALICRRLKVSTVPAWIILGIYAFGRNNETWWTLIPPAQNIGELFLLSGFLSWIKFRAETRTGFKTAALFLFLCAALVKESFIFCIPFVWMADFFFFSPHKKLFTKEYFQLFLIFFLPFAGLTGIIFFSKTIYSYAYSDSVLSILAYNAIQFLFSSVLLLAPVCMFFLRDHVITRRNLLKFSILTFSWLVIQLVLLKGIKMDDQHHYLVPGLLLVLLLSALSLHFIRTRSRVVYFSLVGVYLLVTTWQAKNTFVNSGYYAAQVTSFYKMAGAIKNSNPRKIVYVTDKAIAGDWLMGTSAIFRNEGINAPIKFCSAAEEVTPWEKRFLETRPPLTFTSDNFNELAIEPGDWLIYVDAPQRVIYNENSTSLSFGEDRPLPPRAEDLFIGKKFSFYDSPFYNLSLSVLAGNSPPVHYARYVALTREKE